MLQVWECAHVQIAHHKSWIGHLYEAANWVILLHYIKWFVEQQELTVELAARSKVERSKQEDATPPSPVKVENRTTGSAKRKSQPVNPRPRKPTKNTASPPSSKGSNKKEKLLCLCRTPYDDTKYVLMLSLATMLISSVQHNLDSTMKEP